MRVGQLFLDRGWVDEEQVVPESWLDKMIQPHALSSKYGYHIWIEAFTDSKPELYNRDAETAFLALDTFYQDGASHQRVYVIPSQALLIVRIGENPQQ